MEVAKKLTFEEYTQNLQRSGNRPEQRYHSANLGALQDLRKYVANLAAGAHTWAHTTVFIVLEPNLTTLSLEQQSPGRAQSWHQATL